MKASFVRDPEITILHETANIHFIISGTLTHIVEENCVTDTDVCAKFNISVPSNRQNWLLADTIIHDFYAEVPLADTEATRFVFSFWMYDGEDVLYSDVVFLDTGHGK